MITGIAQSGALTRSLNDDDKGPTHPYRHISYDNLHHHQHLYHPGQPVLLRQPRHHPRLHPLRGGNDDE